MRRSKTVPALALALAIGLLAPPNLAFGSTSSSNIDGPTGLQYSSTLNASADFIGSVVGPSGTAYPDARVELVAWPKGEQLGNLADGATVPTRVVAVDRTSSTGQFKLAPAKASLYPYATSSGAVSFEVVVYADGLTSSRFLDPVENLGNPNARAATLTTDLDSFDLWSAPDVVTDSTAQTPTAGGITPMEACYTKKVKSLGLKWAVVGEAYVRKSNVTATFSYKSGASTTLGIATTTPTSLAWRASGSVTNESTNKVDFAPLTSVSNKKYRTGWVYDQFNSTCTGVTSARATTFASGISNLTPSTVPTANYCVPFQANTGLTKDAGKATTNSTGVDLGTTIGIDVSAQAGFTEQTSLGYKFSANGRLCGQYGYPGASNAGRLVAKS